MSRKLQRINFTAFPNVILDNLPEVSCAELKVIAVICRQTFGYHQERALLSISLLMKLTGLSDQGIKNSLDSLISRGWVLKVPSGQSFTYELSTEDEKEPANSVGGTGDVNPPTQLGGHANSVGEQPANSVGTLNKESIKRNSLKKPRASLGELFTGEPIPVVKEKTEEEKAGEIYAAYPRKVGRPEAIKKIVKALEKTTFETLLQKTRAFAASVKGTDISFIPHPKTWFNQERFNDELAHQNGRSAHTSESLHGPGAWM